MIGLAVLVSVVLAPLEEPVSTRNHRAWSLAFLRMPPAPAPLARGAEEWSAALGVANDLRRHSGLDEDYEVHRLSIGFRRGLGRERDVWAEAVLMNRNGGFLDSWIDQWHRRVLGWTDPVRDATRRGRAEVAGSRGSYGAAEGLGDLTLGATQALDDRTRASVAVKLPTGAASKLLGSGSADVGASVDYRLPLGRAWSAAFQVGLVAQGRGPLAEQALAALIWSPNSHDRWIAQWQHERAPLRVGETAPHRLISFGYRRRLGSSQTLELYFSEDKDLFEGHAPLLASVGPDFTFGARLTWRP